MLFDKIISESKDVVFINTTCPSREDARTLGLSAIKRKLAISIDFWLIDSIYPWHGVIQEVDQYFVMFATKKSLCFQLMKFIEEKHPYVTPMIIRTDVTEVNPSYESWVYSTLGKKEEYKTWSEDKKEKEDKEEAGYHFGRLK